MTDYTNPTDIFSGTEGDDRFVFTVLPAFPGAHIDALGGNDRLTVQIDYDLALSFEAIDWSNVGSFMASVRSPYQSALLIYQVENVEMRGTSGNDGFKVQLGSNPLGTSVVMDGAAGQDKLTFDWSKYASGLSFIVDGSAISSSYGTFSNIETFDITAGPGNDTITTGSGNDNISTGTGVDVIRTGAGNDSIYSESDGGSVDGGDGIDYYNGNFGATSAALTVNIGSTITASNGIVVSNVEGFGIGGGTGNDIFNVTTAAAGIVYGNSGFDTVSYNAASASTAVQVTISAYLGNQLDGYIGTAGNGLTFQQFESVTLTGTQFGDQFSISGNYSGAGLTLNAGGGVDMLMLDLRQSSAGTSFSVSSTGVISSNRGSFSNFESFGFSGGFGADTFVVGTAADGLSGGGGSDYLDGGAGDDSLIGGNGFFEDDGVADTLIGGLGNDTIGAGYGDAVSGGSGTDQLYFNALGGLAGVTANLAALTAGGTITVAGASLSGIETISGVYGSNFADTLTLGKYTAGFEVQVYGWAGDDRIVGTSVVDRIDGGAGNDTMTGGLGKDKLVDYAGDNTFIDTAAGLNGDIINGLDAGDRIIITDANINSFTFSYVRGAGYLPGLLTYSGGSITVDPDIPGRIVASAAAGGGVQLTVQPVPVGTIEQIANQLVSGYWDGDQRRFDVSQGGSISVNISGLNATEQNLARVALSEWSDISGLSFQEVATGGQILFDHSEDPAGSVAYTEIYASGGLISSSIVHIPSSWITDNGTRLNSYSFQTYVHEIGHALGLGHAGNYNIEANYFTDALYSNDSWATSVMSYFDQSESKYFYDLGFTREYALTPMQADILAMQSLYGLSSNTRSGDTIYGFGSNAGRDVYNITSWDDFAYTIFDNGGIDTLDYSGYGRNQVINLNSEACSNVGYGTGNVSIARGTVIENAIGGEGSDTLIGNSSDNVLTGNRGGDVLTGGDGRDTFRDTAFGLWGDAISDFAIGDRIVITDATLSGFTLSLNDSTLTYSGGSLRLGAPISGQLRASAAAGGGVQLSLEAVQNDYNGDGRADILWASKAGQLTNWLATANGGFVANSANAYNVVPSAWHVEGTGDFNADGRTDLLWRNDDGGVTSWLANGNGGFAYSTTFSTTVPTAWQIVGTGDFNGDTRNDILWRNSDGTITDWLSNASGGFTASTTFSTYVPTDWSVVGTGDFNGDGRDDILWRNDAGQLTDWLRTADGGFASNVFSVYVPTNWSVVATGDFNGDGRSDVLWREANGHLTDWLGLASGALVNNGANASTFVPANWQVAAVGDFNGDARDDILWRDETGQMTSWLGTGNGGFIDNSANAASFVSPDWQVENLFV